MKRKKVNYTEGDLFEILLENKKQFLGLITRRKGTSKLLLGHFWVWPADRKGLELPDPHTMLTSAMFSGLGFEIGNWKLLGQGAGWNRSNWPVPLLKRYDDLRKVNYAVSYNDDITETGSQRITDEAAVNMPEDGVHGYLSLENYLDSITG